MPDQKIYIIATTISGSISDWSKVEKIVPLFKEHGIVNVELFAVDSHKAARKKTAGCILEGGRIIISAGGSGTFNSVLEGCCDSGVPLNEITLGFLRKGSADLIGKTLGMPDEINQAVQVFAESIKQKKTAPCDILFAESALGKSVPRHFVGYGGAEIFGMIPYFTENRFIKYYKGILSQLFGDLGPFFIGALLACAKKQVIRLNTGKKKWRVIVDGEERDTGYFQAFIIVNGDLGKDMPLAKDKPLGSGNFYLFTLRDQGMLRLMGQFRSTWDASVLSDPDKWGFNSYEVHKELKLVPDTEKQFEINVDGSTMHCAQSAVISKVDTINLISGREYYQKHYA
ncbi:diacylglycerol/lipid kinase family protein [candidate division KSB1 bacterium]